MQYIVACGVLGFRYFPILKTDLHYFVYRTFLLNHAVAADFVHI